MKAMDRSKCIWRLPYTLLMEYRQTNKAYNCIVKCLWSKFVLKFKVLCLVFYQTQWNEKKIEKKKFNQINITRVINLHDIYFVFIYQFTSIKPFSKHLKRNLKCKKKRRKTVTSTDMRADKHFSFFQFLMFEL